MKYITYPTEWFANHEESRTSLDRIAKLNAYGASF